MVKGEDKRRGTWKIGRIDELFVGEDSVIKGLLIKTAKEFLDQPVQTNHCCTQWNFTATISLMIVTRLKWE